MYYNFMTTGIKQQDVFDHRPIFYLKILYNFYLKNPLQKSKTSIKLDFRPFITRGHDLMLC